MGPFLRHRCVHVFAVLQLLIFLPALLQQGTERPLLVSAAPVVSNGVVIDPITTPVAALSDEEEGLEPAAPAEAARAFKGQEVQLGSVRLFEHEEGLYTEPIHSDDLDAYGLNASAGGECTRGGGSRLSARHLYHLHRALLI